MLSTTVTIFVAALLSSADGHLAINNPVPIPGSGIKDPLDSTGSNFPCHGIDLSVQGARTSMAVGDTKPLSFDLGNGANTAVHGGGSCQISITYDTDPVKVKDPSNWKVIMSYIGGCPTDATGNLPTAVQCNGNNAPNCVNNLSFQIPPEVENGDAILAWTWFNNVGNREMYMNCAAVSFTGGQNKVNALPNMFVANLDSINQCQTTENFNTDFPNPGQYVQMESPLNYPLKAPVGSGCGVSSVSNTTQSSAAPYQNSSLSVLPSMTIATTNISPSSPVASSSATCQEGAVSCSTPGFFCIDKNTFGECALGCAVPIQMAPGTTCAGNSILKA